MNRIKEIRNGRGISQKDLARRANICQSILCAVETGRLKPGRLVITRIARTLKVKESELALQEKDSEAESLAAPASESLNQTINGGKSTHGD